MAHNISKPFAFTIYDFFPINQSVFATKSRGRGSCTFAVAFQMTAGHYIVLGGDVEKSITDSLVKGGPIVGIGNLYPEEYKRKFAMEKAGFQMVKNPADNTRALKKSCFFPSCHAERSEASQAQRSVVRDSSLALSMTIGTFSVPSIIQSGFEVSQAADFRSV